MNPATFFRLALLLPLVAPLILLPFGLNWVSGVLLLSLVFGGIQYIVFAVALSVWIGRAQSVSHIRRISLAAPVLFIPVQVVGWAIYGYVVKAGGTEGLWAPLLAFSVYTLIVGYAYVLAVNLLYSFLFKRRSNAAAL